MAAEKDPIRIGKISSFDFKKGVAKITYEDRKGSTTVNFSMLGWGEYWLPKIGDQVAVAHLTNGSTSAVILGPVWHDGHRPPEGQEELYRKDYNRKYGDAYERYDHKAQKYKEVVTGTYDIETTKDFALSVNGTTIIKVKADGSIEITAPTGITINTPLVTVTGDIVADGKKVSLAHHKHPGDSGGTTEEPN